MTTQPDPGAYVRRRYAGLLELENVMAVENAATVERLVHKMLGKHRIRDGQGRELFYGLDCREVQEAFEACSVFFNGCNDTGLLRKLLCAET